MESRRTGLSALHEPGGSGGEGTASGGRLSTRGTPFSTLRRERARAKGRGDGTGLREIAPDCALNEPGDGQWRNTLKSGENR